MTQQAMLNLTEPYEAAAKQARGIIAGVKPDHFTKPTPCTEWNVQALLSHIVFGPNMVASVFSSGTMPADAISDTQPAQASTTKDALAAFDTGVAAVLKAANAPRALEKKAKTPIGEMTCGQFMSLGLMDIVIHAWDLAKATGEGTRLDPKLVDFSYEVLKPVVEQGRAMKAFGPEVKVPANASLQDKLLGLSGRRP